MHIRLEDAALCVDCEAISETAGTVCPACGHGALLSLARVLGTIPAEEAARVVTIEEARQAYEQLRRQP